MSKKIFLPIILVMCVVIFGIFAAVETQHAITDTKRLRLSEAAHEAQTAQWFTQPFTFLTAHQLAEVEAWNDTLMILTQASNAQTTAQAYLPATLESQSNSQNLAATLLTQIQKLDSTNHDLQTQIRKSLFINHFLPPKLASQYQQASATLSDTNTLAQNFLTGKHRFILLFQNSEELRATGGFMGSYLIVELNNGQVSQLDIQDIYEPDGQFQGYMVAPPGVKEYLSSGKGLRLPDANWNPDFPSSAKTILNFFSLGNEKNLDGIGTMNLSMAQDLLQEIGNLYLPDYHETVTPQNLADIARADRANFFPGSQQKRNFLQALFTQVKLKLTQLTPEQQKNLATLFFHEMSTKNLQLYANDDTIEKIFVKNGLAGEAGVPIATSTATASSSAQELYLFPVESNVGINKANKAITRQIEIKFPQIQMHFQNHNTDSGNDYINYQRIFISNDAAIQSITVAQNQITNWNEDSVTFTNGQTYKEIGFLVTVPHGTEQTVTIQLSLTNPPTTLYIQKQSGQPPTPYTIITNNDTKTLLLEKDEVVGL